MPEFCDVALPVPLDTTFTYRISGQGELAAISDPVVGGRVLVPFRTERLSGIVTALHDNAPSVTAKSVYSVIDETPVLSEQLLQLGRWIAQYYVAPIGEVLRTMLPLAAEVRRRWAYRATTLGEQRLFESAQRGASRLSKLEIDDQMVEYAVLNHLSSGEQVLEGTLRSATGASRELLRGLMRKRWIMREDVTAVRDARRMIHYVVLENHPLDPDAAKNAGKLNANQRAIVEFLQQSEGRAALDAVRSLSIPRTTLNTLVKRSLVRIEEEAADYVSSVQQRSGSPLAYLLNPAQRGALASIEQAIQAREFSVTLLHGVTGSGKTAVYLSAMKEVLASGRSSILLVPEIGLTPAAAANLHHIFGDEVAILHSGLSDDERAEQWHRIRRSEARVVVGTRSAVFAPVSELALIVVDEEHDQSYKQGETPRYHARDVAIMRGKLAGAAVVLGSATPALETYKNACTGKYKLVEMRERVADRPLPQVEVLDMRTEAQQAGGGEDQLFSRALIAEASERMERGEQVIILLNRRGYSAIVLCRACGESLQCKNCAIALTHHRGKEEPIDRVAKGQRMECHYCGYREKVPSRCPKCDSEHVFFLGAGSEKVEDRLQGIFPRARIGRLDRDTVRGRDDFERMLNRLHSGEIDMLVGTQMIAKGHDIHGVTMVGVVGADNALGFPDFRAAERTFQLLTQVAGRAGRGNTPGKVILQTYNPDHYAIQFAAKHDFIGFYQKEMRSRRWMHYPPFTALANVLIRSDRLDHAMHWSSDLGHWIAGQNLDGVRVLGPAAAPIARLQRDYRYHFVLKSESREKLNRALRQMLHYAATQKIPRTGIIVDVDALSLM